MDNTIILKIIQDCFKWDSYKIPQADILMVAHDNDRSLRIDEQWYSPLINTIEDDLVKNGAKCVGISRIISRIKGKAAFGDVFSPEGGFARALIKKRFKSIFLDGRYSYSNSEERIWERILETTQVRAVFAIQPSRELCVACHKKGIWVADVQHGVIADEHPWYGESYRSSDPKNWLPNAFLVWDPGSAAVIQKWASEKQIAVLVIGNRWVVRFIKNDPDDKIVKKINGLNILRQPNQSKPAILVSLSWGNKNIDNGFLPNSVCDLIRETVNDYKWMLRLHPNQLNGFATDEGRRFKSFFVNNLNENIEWEVPTRCPLPSVLSSIDLHLSWNSSVSIEAAQMGIKSALMDPHLKAKPGYYTYYRSTGKIDLIPPDKNVLHHWIQKNKNSKVLPEDTSKYDQEYFKVIAKLTSR